MARTRDLRPQFFKNEELGQLTPLTRLLFAGLWCQADREGKLEDRPQKLKVEILPYDECNVDEMLIALHQKNFIIRYECNQQKYIKICTFLEHQKIHPKESPSVIPDPVQKSRGKTRQAAAKHLLANTQPLASNPFPSLPSSPSLPPYPPSGEPSRFEEFWKVYPKKVGKAPTLKYWQRKQLDPRFDEIMAGLSALKTTSQWTRDAGQYIPNPLTFLRQERWKDEVNVKLNGKIPRWERILHSAQVRYELSEEVFQGVDLEYVPDPFNGTNNNFRVKATGELLEANMVNEL